MAKPKQVFELEAIHRLWFLSTAHADFGQSALAAGLALELAKETDSAGKIALAEISIIRFARPFSRCVVPQERAAGAATPPQVSVALTADYLPDIPGATSVLEGAIKMRDRIAAHSDLEMKPFRLRKMRGTHGGIRWQMENLVPSVGDENLHLLLRLAKALERKTAEHVYELAEQLFPHVSVGQTITVEFQRGER